MIYLRNTVFASIFLALIISCDGKSDMVEFVKIPDSSKANDFYVSNRDPLIPNVLIKLPVGSIKPDGWLREILKRQASGLAGNLNKISAWLQKDNNAWLSNHGEGEWGWEEVPYWLKGYANMGYILDDQEIIDEALVWINAALKSQRDDGNFGPVRVNDEGVADFWANMVMLYCLQSHYEHTGDERVINLMTNYFKYQLSIPDEKFLSKVHYWQRIRGGDNLHSVLWLFNRTGDKWLLDLAEKVHRNAAPWNSRTHALDDIHNWKEKREGIEWPDWYSKLIDWHNVNVAQGFREPAQYYQLSHDSSDLQASYDNFNIVRKYFGQVPGGMFGADENARPGYDDPRQGIETCGMVEQMNSDEHLLRITGDIFWADNLEDVAFNSYPAAFMPDLNSLRYITSPNMVLNDDKNHRPGIMNSGPFLMMNPFSSRCCQHNHTQGWPYLIENLWMATPDNGLAAVVYCASKVNAKVGSGTEVTIKSKTKYPFEDEIRFTLSMHEPDSFPLYFRIPKWCESVKLEINNELVDLVAESGKYIRIMREWENNDVVTLKLHRELKMREWRDNHNSVSLDYGPLTFSLKIKERYIKKESDKTALWDSKWQEGVEKDKWPSFEIHPSSSWNYGLIFDEKNFGSSFKIIMKEWPENNFPFEQDSVPIYIEGLGKKIKNWKIDEFGLAGELQDSPVFSDEPVEKVKLIPMGAARLRISSFPVISEDETANKWE